MLVRAFTAAVGIVLLTAGAVSAAVFLQVEEIVRRFDAARPVQQPPIVLPEVEDVDPGEPRTIMVLGSDLRYGMDEKTDAHSDTILLVRLDADARATSVMSIPRDLRVPIPGYSSASKINQAFTEGGPRLTLRTVRDLMRTARPRFAIHHVVQVDFNGFQRLVNEFGCAYVDVDREYYNDRGGPGGYAVIDLDEGYQRLCGSDALAYARYRHTDSDIVRGARQQEVIRQVLAQASTSDRFTFSRRGEIAELFGRFVEIDRSLHDRQTLFSIGKLLAATAEKPVVSVPFPVRGEEETDLFTEPYSLGLAIDRFMRPQTVRRRRSRVTRAGRPRSRRASAPNMANVEREGRARALVARRRARFPVYFPARIPARARIAAKDVRTYRFRDRGERPRRAYRMVLPLGAPGDYAGVQGMTWRRAPILAGPYETVRAGRRNLRVYYDGRRVRLVAWFTPRAVYYVHNSLQRTLSRPEMIATAASLRRP